MNLPDVFAGFELVAPVSDGELRNLEAHLSTPLPSSYRQFLMVSNGGEGPVGEEGWLRLYRVGELLEVSHDYGISAELPGFLLTANRDCFWRGFKVGE